MIEGANRSELWTMSNTVERSRELQRQYGLTFRTRYSDIEKRVAVSITCANDSFIFGVVYREHIKHTIAIFMAAIFTNSHSFWIVLFKLANHFHKQIHYSVQNYVKVSKILERNYSGRYVQLSTIWIPQLLARLLDARNAANKLHINPMTSFTFSGVTLLHKKKVLSNFLNGNLLGIVFDGQHYKSMATIFKCFNLLTASIFLEWLLIFVDFMKKSIPNPIPLALVLFHEEKWRDIDFIELESFFLLPLLFFIHFQFFEQL